MNLFLTNHEYKNLHRDNLTAYYKSTDPIVYAEYIKNKIDNCDEEIIIIDDLRNFLHLNFMKHNYKNTKIIRINSTDESKLLREWVKTEYDNKQCENELDDYDKFDFVFDNDSTKEILEFLILENIDDIIY